MSPDVRLSPDWTRVAIRAGLNDLWEVTGGVAGLRLTDEEVRDWLPMVRSDKVVCPWCGKYVAPTSKGALRRHGAVGAWPPKDCEGTSRKPSEFKDSAA